MRKSLVRRGFAAVLATATMAVGVLAGAAPAQASVALSSVGLSTGTVVLNGDAGCGNRVKVTVRVWNPYPTSNDYIDVAAHVIAPNGDDVDFLLLNYASRSGYYANYSDYVYLCGPHSPGTYRVRTTLTWWDTSISEMRTAEKTASFAVKRPTTLTYNASPEPVKRGAKLTNAGVLKFDPYGYGPYYGKSGATLKFYFKSTSAKTYAYKGSVVTGKGGKYSKKITASAAGTWKVVYAGDGTHQAQVKYDAVKVKK